MVTKVLTQLSDEPGDVWSPVPDTDKTLGGNTPSDGLLPSQKSISQAVWSAVLANARVVEAFDEVTSRSIVGLDSFQAWLKAGAGWGAQTGMLGETGIPNGNQAVSDGTATQVAKWTALLAKIGHHAGELGMDVFYWDADECQNEQYSMYGPPSVGGLTGPLTRAYASSRVLENEATNASIGAGPRRGIALKDGIEGAQFSNQDSSTVFSNARTTGGKTFNIGAGITPGTEYNYGRPATFKFLANRNVKFIRMCVRWERIQPALLGNLDATEMGRLDAAILAAQQAGCYIMLDIHNGGGYYVDDGSKGVRYSIGQGSVTVAAFVDLWNRLSSHYMTPAGTPDISGLDGKNNLKANIVWYELMNEPVFYTTPGTTTSQGGAGKGAVDLSTTAKNRYIDAVNQAGQAIRLNGDNTALAVHPYSGGGAGPTFWGQHPGGPFMFQTGSSGAFQTNIVWVAHMYHDRGQGSTSYADSYDHDLPTSVGQGYLPQRTQRSVFGQHLADTGMLNRKFIVTGQSIGGIGAISPIPALASGNVDVYSPTWQDSSLGLKSRVGIISGWTFNGTNGTTVSVYVRPRGQTGTNANWLRYTATMTGNPIAHNVPTFLNAGDTLVVNCSANGVTMAFNLYDFQDTELVIATCNVGTTDTTLFTCPTGCMAKVVNSGVGTSGALGWTSWNQTGAAVTVNGKIKNSGQASVQFGAGIAVAANAPGNGPASAYPGVPSSLIDAVLDDGDAVVLSASAVGVTVWALFEVMGQ
jgi:hypothetical protein